MKKKLGSFHASQSKKARPPDKVYIVDDHTVVREGYAMAINERDDLAVCGGAGSLAEAKRQIPLLEPDAILMDLSLGHESGLDLISHIQATDPDLPILVVSMHEESTHALRALKTGALGYVMKNEKMSKVIEGIRTVLRGELFVSGKLKSKMLRQAVSPDADDSDPVAGSLTKRELEVFGLIADGLSSHDIGKRLHVSPRTIDTHKERIRNKLGLKNATQLQHRAFLWKQQQNSV